MIGCSRYTIMYWEQKGVLRTVVGTDGWSIYLIESEVREFARTYARIPGGRRSKGKPRTKPTRDARILGRFRKGESLEKVCAAERIPLKVARRYWRTFKYGAEGIDERKQAEAKEREERARIRHQRALELTQAKERAAAALARARMIDRIVSGKPSPPVEPSPDVGDIAQSTEQR